MWRAPCVITMSVVVSFLASPCSARTIHVPAEQPTIQAGIDAAVAGDEVVVAEGEYTGPGNCDIIFGGKAVTLRSANGPEKCTIDCQASFEENHRGFLFNSGEGPDTVVEGLTITNGYVMTGLSGGGGGILCINASPTIRNCIVSQCTVYGPFQAGDAVGGGIRTHGSAANPSFFNCTVIDCTAFTTFSGQGARGGGVCIGGSFLGGNGQLNECTLIGNVASTSAGVTFGGGAALNGNGLMVGCSVIGNSALVGGGVFLAGGEMAECSIVGNSSPQGGGISALGGSLVRDCLISGNTVGGGVDCMNATLQRCIIMDNNHSGASTGGGGGGGVVCHHSTLKEPSVIDNCLIVGNATNGDGGGVRCTFGPCHIINSTIAANSDADGAGVVAKAQSALNFVAVTLQNCIVVNNDVPRGAQLAVEQLGPTAAPASLTVSYSNIEGGVDVVLVVGGATLTWGEGNLDSEPLFVDPDGPDDTIGTEDDDYHLAAGSPCIDAASNPAVPRDVTEDLDGNPRFQDDPATRDIGLGRAPIVDMGAYEFQPPLDPANLDEDGDVDGFDLALLLAAWGPCGDCAKCSADLDDDCDVDGFDLALLLSAWKS